MDDVLRAFVLAPVAPLEQGVRIDSYAEVTIADEPTGTIRITTAAGERLIGRISVPAQGVVRIQLALSEGALAGAIAQGSASPMLVSGLADQPASLTATADGIVATGPGVALQWKPKGGGIRFGTLHSGAETQTLTGAALTTGRLQHADGSHRGWLHTFAIGADDAVYGGGESFQGPDLRGRIRRCVNAETIGAAGLDLSYLSVPFFWSDAGWGVYAHTGAPMRADVGSTHPQVLGLEIPEDTLDIFCYGGEPAELLRQHHAVTGLPGAFPDWALGVWTSRGSYLSAGEVIDVLDSYAATDCPVNVVHLDWWQAGTMNDLTTNWQVDRERWPAGWSKQLQDRGVRLSLWHNPYLSPGTPDADEATAGNLLLRDDAGNLSTTPDMPGRLVLDFTNPATCTWWRQKVTALVIEEGASSVKPDFAEEVPPTARCADGRNGWQVRNEYSVRYQRESHTALKAALGTEAVAMFCRSGTAGAQRYPCHWVGDSPSTWEGMTSAVRACLSLSLSGFAFVASDVGGFWTDLAYEAVMNAFATLDPDFLTADVDPELFARWAQWGALTPVMRFHGMGRREPWAYPDPFGSVAVAACQLRERLAPYLASISLESSETGTPMMRPMPLAYPGDRAARDAMLQYLLGPDLLVAPVLEPGGGLRLWVPSGQWVGLAGAGDLTGPGWIVTSLELASVPAWVRVGSDLERQLFL